MDLQKPRQLRNRLLELLNDFDEWIQEQEESNFTLDIIDDSTVSISWGGKNTEEKHGKDDEKTSLPTTFKEYGEILNGDYVVAGLADIDGVAHLLVQNQVKYNGVWTNCGYLFTSTDLKNWESVDDNPVLIEPRDWQGQENGVPHRIAPRTLIKWDDTYYAYTRDRLGKYPGIRATGVFSSNDLVNWQGYDKWFTDVEQVQGKVPDEYLTGKETERCYLKCATVFNNEIYIIVNLQDVDGEDTMHVLKGNNPVDFSTFEYVSEAYTDNLYFIDGWYWIGRGDAKFNTLRVQKVESPEEPFERGEGFEISNGVRETVFPFYYGGKWNLFYEGRDKNVYLATQL